MSNTKHNGEDVMPRPSFSDWLKQKGYKNWVVFTRRTPRIVRKYGDDVQVLTPRRYSELRKEWEAAQ